MKIVANRFLISLALVAFAFANESIITTETTSVTVDNPSDLASITATNVLTTAITNENDLLKTFSKSSVMGNKHDGAPAIPIVLASYEVIDVAEKSIRRLPHMANDEREPKNLVIISDPAPATTTTIGIRGTKGVATTPADPTNNRRRRVLLKTTPKEEEELLTNDLLPLAGFLEDHDRRTTTTFGLSGTYHEFSMPQTTPIGY